jgi:hypothetical protein
MFLLLGTFIVREYTFVFVENAREENFGLVLKPLRSPEIDSKEPIPPAFVVRRSGTITLFLLGFWPPIDCSKIQAQCICVLAYLYLTHRDKLFIFK